MPTLVATPCPSGPVVVSTPEVQWYSGCPGHLLSSWRKRRMSSTVTVGDERRDERRPARLMRGAESFAGLGVEVFVEEQLVAPGGILLEERGRPPDGPAAAAVGEEEAEEAALEVVRHGAEMCEPSGAGRELDRERVAEAGVQAAERADHEVVEGEPDRPPPVGIAAELPGGRFGGLVVEHELASARRLDEDERVVAVVSRERAQPVGREELLLVQHGPEEAPEPRDVHQHHEVGAFPDLLDDAVSGGLLAPAVRDEPLHPRAEFRQPRPEGMWNR